VRIISGTISKGGKNLTMTLADEGIIFLSAQEQSICEASTAAGPTYTNSFYQVSL
jgi:hypothetical protein